MLQVGDKIPDFHTLDADGIAISSDDLLGSITVIYFYPKDDTPGCTKEACDFRDNMEELDSQGIIVLGVSCDTMESHQKFSEKHELNFPLLVDENKEICTKFGVIREKEINGKKAEYVERTTFIIDEKGIIRWIEQQVNVEHHIQRVLHELNILEK